MSQWDDRFRNHSVHNTLSEIFRKLDEAEPDIEATDIAESFSRLYRVMKHVKSELEAADPELVSATVLENIGGHLTTINNRLDNFLANRELKPLTNANADADMVLDVLARLPGIKTPTDIEGISQDVSEFRQRMSGVVQKLEEHVSGFMDEFEKQEEGFRKDTQSLSDRVQEVANRLKEQDIAISAKKEHLDNMVSKFQSQFSDAQSKRESDYIEKVTQRDDAFRAFRDKIENEMKEFFDQRKGKADELFSQHSQQVKEGINALDTEVKTRVGALETQVQTLVDGFEKKEAEFFTQQENEAKAQIDVLNAQAQKAKELVKLVSDISVTGNYANVATEEQKTADRLRWIGLGLMGLMVAMAFLTVFLFVGKVFDWKIAFFRIVSIGIVAIPAFYLVRESDKHRQGERRNRKFQLELTAIDPYLKTLPEEMQDALKKKLADRLFAQPEPVTEPGETVKAKTVFGLLESLVNELVKKIR